MDNQAAFLELLSRRTRAAGVGERVHPRMETMSALPFGESSFDLLWVEGSIYNVGFGEGLAAWRTSRPNRTVAQVHRSQSAVWFA